MRKSKAHKRLNKIMNAANRRSKELTSQLVGIEQLRKTNLAAIRDFAKDEAIKTIRKDA